MVLQKAFEKGCFAEWVLQFLRRNFLFMLEVRERIEEFRVLSQLLLEEARVRKFDWSCEESQLSCDETSSLISKHH
jgi:hypothetical protein